MRTKVKNTETLLSLGQFHISESCGFILPEPLVGHFIYFTGTKLQFVLLFVNCLSFFMLVNESSCLLLVHVNS